MREAVTFVSVHIGDAPSTPIEAQPSSASVLMIRLRIGDTAVFMTHAQALRMASELQSAVDSAIPAKVA